MSQEMHIDVTTTFMESNKVKADIIASMTDICNLSGLACIHSNGQKAKILNSCDLIDRFPDLAYIKLCCYLDGSLVYKRVIQAMIDFKFCIKSPQSSYYQKYVSIAAISSPINTKK